MTSLKLYMSSTHMPQQANWLDCVASAAEMGFDGLELFGTEYEQPELMSTERLDALAKAAQAKKLVLSAHPWIEWGDLPEEELARRLTKLMADCARLGQREIVLHMDFLAHREAGMARVFRMIDPLCPFLSREGMTILLENVPAHDMRELGSEVGDFDALFAHYEAGAPVQMNIDVGHAHIMGTLAELAHSHGTRWRYTHIDDNAGVEDSHFAPGKGSIHWLDVAKCAGAVGYTGPLMMEYASRELHIGMPVLTEAYAAHGMALHAIRPQEG
ncbi:MAG: TIM barrel protein [Clostridia bacterium]